MRIIAPIRTRKKPPPPPFDPENPPAPSRYASPSGNDNLGDGSVNSPYLTIAKLVSELGEGWHGILRGGIYDGDHFIDRSEITIRGYPLERPILKGPTRIRVGYDNVTIQDVVLNGNGTHTRKHTFATEGNFTTLRRCEITNEYQGIGIQPLDGSEDCLIEECLIYENGVLPPGNHHHGIYNNGTRTVIRYNWIYDNADRGIQNYPSPNEADIYNNVIWRNGAGINFSCDANACSAGVIAHNNIIGMSRREIAYGHTQGGSPNGTNELNTNIFYRNPESIFQNNCGLSLSENYSHSANFCLTVPPDFRDEANNDFTIVDNLYGVFEPFSLSAVGDE